MFKLFDDRYRPSEGAPIPFQLRESRTQTDVIFKNLVSYFQRSSYRPTNQHLLTQILRGLDHGVETPLEKVLQNLDARWMNYTRTFGITSSVSYGKTHQNVFYGSEFNAVSEYIVALDLCDIDPFDPEAAWKDVSPFKVLYHPFSDLKWLLPKGDSYSLPKEYDMMPEAREFSVVGIDIRLLAMQYNLFKKEQVRLHGDAAITNPGAFLITQALPLIYPSHIDQVVWNMCAIETGLRQALVPTGWLPVSLPDASLHVRKMTKAVMPKLLNSRRYYVQTLETMPAVFSKNALRALELPYIPTTRQSNWIRILSRWKHVKFLIDLQGLKGMNANSSYLTDLMYDLRVFVNEKGYKNFQNTYLEDQFLEWATRYIAKG